MLSRTRKREQRDVEKVEEVQSEQEALREEVKE